MKLYQIIRPAEPGHIAGVRFRVAHLGLGKSINVSIQDVVGGVPSGTQIATAKVTATSTTTDTTAVFSELPWLEPDYAYAIVWDVGDQGFRLAIADTGKFDAVANRWVTASPNISGFGSSVSGVNWTPLAGITAKVTILRAAFPVQMKTVPLATIAAVGVTGLDIDVDIVLQSVDVAVRIDVTLPSGRVLSTSPSGAISFDAPQTGNIGVVAVLTGTARASPSILPKSLIAARTLLPDGDSVTRAFACGDNRRLRVEQTVYLSGDATCIPSYQDAGGEWQPLTMTGWDEAGDGWRTQYYEAAGVTTPTTRVKLALHGSAAHRPLVESLVALPLSV